MVSAVRAAEENARPMEGRRPSDNRGGCACEPSGGGCGADVECFDRRCGEQDVCNMGTRKEEKRMS